MLALGLALASRRKPGRTYTGISRSFGGQLPWRDYAPAALWSKPKETLALTQARQHPIDRHGMPLAAGGRGDFAGVQLRRHLPVRQASKLG